MCYGGFCLHWAAALIDSISEFYVIEMSHVRVTNEQNEMDQILVFKLNELVNTCHNYFKQSSFNLYHVLPNECMW